MLRDAVTSKNRRFIQILSYKIFKLTTFDQTLNLYPTND